MSLARRYDPNTAEPRIQELWRELGVYQFEVSDERPVYSVDTPPATVSGHLHIGHIYSYSQPDFLARFWRMNGYNVFYPMGYDDNGLPTGRFVEKLLGKTAREVGQTRFTQECVEVGSRIEQEYQALWQRLGLSVDWRYNYRTIEPRAVRISQISFLDLYERDLAYHRTAPTIWCPECGTAIAQAELNDLERETTFYTLAFRLDDGTQLPIATTRPELLPACVAIFVHPQDPRYHRAAGHEATVPLFDHRVPILVDPAVEPEKGTGAVMCCTFGDVTDVQWWYAHHLPLRQAITPDGRMASAAGPFSGLRTGDARQRMVEAMTQRDQLLERQPVLQSVRVHERCDSPAEYMATQQWFVRVLDYRDQLLQAADEMDWHPPHMKARYIQWVQDLTWDWCISRQRFFGVPFPVWYCRECDRIVTAERERLPVDARTSAPHKPCACGSESFAPETDVMDTWATSSLSPQIVGRWLTDADRSEDAALYRRVFPMSLRPQAHDIIRTWTFYTIVKSLHHFGVPPWKSIAISGWGIAGQGMGKISKSRGGGPASPAEMIERYSADAVRYWAASTGLGKDAVISEQKMQVGAKLVNKLWSVARFSARFLDGYLPSTDQAGRVILPAALSPADRWILSRLQRLARSATAQFRRYEYAAAKAETESFFWAEVADNYLEMVKTRLYGENGPARQAARFALHHVLLTVLKLFAPFLPYVTEEIYQALFAEKGAARSIHVAVWPTADPRLEDDAIERIGEQLVHIARTVRRYKSAHNLPLGTELQQVRLATGDPDLLSCLREAKSDLMSVTRARRLTFTADLAAPTAQSDGPLSISIVA